jgi:hypothetical protein
VHAADESTLAAADQGHAKFPIQCAVGGHGLTCSWRRRSRENHFAERGIAGVSFVANRRLLSPLAAAKLRLAFAPIKRYDPPVGAAIGDSHRDLQTGHTQMANSRLTWTAIGLVVGLVVGLNVTGVWPQIPIHATATHGQDNFAICTGVLDENVEGLFVLDSVTGELKGVAMNIQTRRFNTFFEYNVARDLPPGSKNPQYRIVTGVTNIRQVVAAGQLARTVVYVAEASSGQVIAYGVPWVTGRHSSPILLREPLVPLDKWQFRTTAIRDK